MRSGQESLVERGVPRAILGLAWPSALGVGTVLLFGLVDTFFVARMGNEELAAISFTYPVSLVAMSFMMGIGAGATSLVARNTGAGDHPRVRRVAANVLLLSLVVAVVVSAVGLNTLEPVFSLMGTPASLVPLVTEYMRPWLWGAALLFFPLMGNAVLRATGDAKSPAAIMLAAGLVNALLDPVLIFGLGPIPALGMRGAAYATVASWLAATVACSWTLVARAKLVSLSRPALGQLLRTWRDAMHVGLPAALTYAMIPLADAMLTRFAASHGTDAVAAFGVGSKVYSVAMVGPMALSMAASPFAGQNFGAGRTDRLREGGVFMVKASLAWGTVLAALLALSALPLARLFSAEPTVLLMLRHYLWVLPVTFGFVGIAPALSAMLNGMNMPLWASAVVVARLFVFTVPAAFAGSVLAGWLGMFIGIAVANLLTGAATALIFLGAVRQLHRSPPNAGHLIP